MKTIHFFACIGLMGAAAGCAYAASAMDELNKGPSVFDTPTPHKFAYSEVKAGDSKVLPRAWKGAPPQISHRIDKYLPITGDDNQCIECHDKPELIGNKETSKRPMPASHYATKDLEEVSGARYNCLQCHVPQANAKLLVENTFGKKR